MALDKYQSMRDFQTTEEPSGFEDPEVSEFEQRGTPRFVVQEHHATALHWDFRLERDGVLVSWAVPRGIPPDPRVNHLAVHTEDHPLSYYEFEGEIPKGEYGGGKVILWDKGTYEREKFSDREVMVVLQGERVQGRYVLFATDAEAKNWMIHRMDPAADPSREIMPADARPLEPVTVESPDEVIGRPGWLYAVAWGGIRVAVAVNGGRCIARSAQGVDVTKRWPELGSFGRAVGALGVVFVAELVRPAAKAPGLVFLEDVMWLDGHSTEPLSFSDRRALLESLDLEGESWKTSPTYDDGVVVLEAARAQGLPGVLAIRDEPGFRPPRLVPA